MNKKLLVVLFLLPVYSILHGQIKQELYKEIPKDPYTDVFAMAPFGEHGIIFFGTDAGKGDANFRYWNFTFFDTSLNEVAKASLDLGERFFYSDCFRDGNHLYLFFNRGTPQGAFGLVTIDAQTKGFGFKLHSLYSEKSYLSNSNGYSGFDKNTWAVFKDILYLFGSTEEQGLLCYDLSTSKRTEHPMSHRITNINFNEHTGEVAILSLKHTYSFEKKKTPAEVHIATFNRQIPVSKNSFPARDGYNLRDAKIFPVEKNHSIVIGLYNLIDEINPSGMFFCNIVDNKAEFTYYNFTDLNNFYNCIPERKRDEAIKRDQKTKEKGKEPAQQESMEMFVVAEGSENNFIAIAQSYSVDMGFQFGFKGMNFSQSYATSVVNGYYHTAATVVAFDAGGKKLWDNCLEMGDMQTLRPEESVTGRINGNTTELLYANDLYFHSKSIAQDAVVSHKDTTQIKTAVPAKDIKYSFVDCLEPWYDNYYIALGRRYKKHQLKDEEIYFFNRVEF